MPYGSVQLIPGVNTERTPTALQAGYSASEKIRFRDGLAQKLGGWSKYTASSVSGTPRHLHGWQDLNSVSHLAVGTTAKLDSITAGVVTDITPRTKTTNPAPDFSTTVGSPTVTIVDASLTSTLSTFDAVVFNVPVSVGGIVLHSIYQIQSILGTTTYTITAASNATALVNNGGAVPSFATTNGSNVVTVTLNDHGLSVNQTVMFSVSTTVNGVTIFGSYNVATVPTANTFTILVAGQATGTSSASMNAGNCQFVYYLNLGPPTGGSGYGSGAYGSGAFGTGSTSAPETGTQITATDWTLDNWGQLLVACPAGGAVYTYDPTGSAGFANAALIEPAPTYNDGMFISISTQILICWGSTQKYPIGMQQDPMLVKWSTVGDFTQFNPLTTNQAGSYRIPTGSRIVSGMSVTNQNLIWTDLDVWAMNYQGPPFVYGFNKIGNGAGLIARHAAQKFRGNVYWMGQTNFYQFSQGGVTAIPCPVWDVVFQNLNSAYVANIRAMPNTPFNEVGWLFPSTASSSGECDSYVKFNVTEPNQPWDYGTFPMTRSAWIDQSILGNPITASPGGVIYQQETTNDADGAPLTASFTTGYFYLMEGEDFAFVDQVLPDMKWGFFNGAQTASVQLTFNVTNFPGDTPIAYGPYTVTQATEYVSVRFRGRQMSVTLQSSDLGSFWRIGKIRYRFAPAGRR